MKITNRKETNTVRYTIDYENGIICNVIIEECNVSEFSNSDRLLIYTFRNEKHKLHYLTDEDYKKILDIHWSDFESKKSIDSFVNPINMSEQDLFEFKDFDKLMTVGSSVDGTYRDQHGLPLSTPIIIDSVHSYIYTKITTLEESEKYKAILDNISYVTKCEIVDIPYYNQNEEGEDTSLYVILKLPENIFYKMYSELKFKYINNECKKWIMEKYCKNLLN